MCKCCIVVIDQDRIRVLRLCVGNRAGIGELRTFNTNLEIDGSVVVQKVVLRSNLALLRHRSGYCAPERAASRRAAVLT
jgi:hypothetical protein